MLVFLFLLQNYGKKIKEKKMIDVLIGKSHYPLAHGWFTHHDSPYVVALTPYMTYNPLRVSNETIYSYFSGMETEWSVKKLPRHPAWKDDQTKTKVIVYHRVSGKK